MSATLAESEVTGEWSPALRVICPKASPDPIPCDCGFVGDWERRFVYVWREAPGRRRSDLVIRRDLAAGRPTRTSDEGYWCIAGYDERCPSCGDIERFDNEANEVARFVEQAKVVVFLDARR